ncbi:hypothetical protein C3L33_04188, partial [Rhododendron williamsianum]
MDYKEFSLRVSAVGFRESDLTPKARLERKRIGREITCGNRKPEEPDAARPEGNKFSEDLESLDLSNAGLTGKIPDSITELKSLRFLGLVNNSLSGNISPRFQYMPCISALYLSGNNFTGEIGFPASFYGRMGSRFRASENPNLCSSAGGIMTARNVVPVGVKPCRKEKGSSSAPDIDSIGRISLGDWNENSLLLPLGGSQSLVLGQKRWLFYLFGLWSCRAEE